MFRLTKVAFWQSVVVFVAVHAICLAAQSAEKPIDADLGGIVTRFTDKVVILIQKQLSEKKREPLQEPMAGPLELRCYRLPEDVFAIGARQRMEINAPFQRVEAVLDNIDAYVEIFPDFKDIHIASREENVLTTVWEQTIPVFFLPNVKYEMLYLLHKPDAKRKVYRYQLKSSKDLTQSDGYILIEAVGPKSTFYTEYDFWNANWGPLKTLAPSRIWEDSIEGLFLSDVGLKLRAENPAWNGEKVKTHARALLKKHGVGACLENKQVPPQ